MFEPRTILVMESFDIEQEKKILRRSFNGKASLAAGVLHILCALVTVATYLYGEYVSALKMLWIIENEDHGDHGHWPWCWCLSKVLVHTPIYAGVWTSLFFLISGIIAIAGKNGQKKKVGEPSQFSFNPLVKSYPRSNWVDETDAENLSK